MNIIKELLMERFEKEFEVSKSLNHDPFNGHMKESKIEGKSFFDFDIELGYYKTPDIYGDCGDGAVYKAELKTIKRIEKENVEIFTFYLRPIKMVRESLKGILVIDEPKIEEERPIIVGYNVKTVRPSNGNMYVKKIHGCLQLTADDLEYEEGETPIFTVILTKEDIGWAVASVHPGEPSKNHIGDYLSKTKHYENILKDKILEGYEDGEYFSDDLLLEPAPDWIYDHIVKR